jgi:hypothetical protein
MSWTRFYQRRHAMEAALTHATRNPGELPYSEHPLVQAAFDSRTDLVLALQYRWTQQLNGRLQLALDEADQNDIDRVEAVSEAWARTAEANSVLRRVLDENLDSEEPAIKQAREAEARDLALAAGLAERMEPAEEVSKIGAAFTALLRDQASTSAHGRRGPVRFISDLLASR